MELSDKQRISLKFIEFIIVLRFVSVIFHELAHFYSFKILGTGTATIEYRVMIFTDVFREPSLESLFFLGPWLEGVVRIDTPLRPEIWGWQFAIYILSGFVVHVWFGIYYSMKRYRSLRYRSISICSFLFVALIGSTADLSAAYHYLGFGWISTLFSMYSILLPALFYLALTVFVWPYSSAIYIEFKKFKKGMITKNE